MAAEMCNYECLNRDSTALQYYKFYRIDYITAAELKVQFANINEFSL